MVGQKTPLHVSIFLSLPQILIKITVSECLTKIDVAHSELKSYNYIEPADKAYGAKVNGTWNGVVGCVHRGVRNKNTERWILSFTLRLLSKDVDMGAANVVTTYERSSVVDFTYAYANDRMIFLVPYPRLANTISGIIRPFQYEVKNLIMNSETLHKFDTSGVDWNSSQSLMCCNFSFFHRKICISYRLR